MPESGPVVANTGPRIGLSFIGRIDLLRSLYSQIHIPSAVVRELVEGRPLAAEASTVPNEPWVVTVEVAPPPDPLLLEDLGRGESEAIALAHRLGASLLLLDDRRARRVAEVAYRLRVKGAAWVLATARRDGLVTAVRPLLLEMRQKGYDLSERLIERTCLECGEPP